MKINCERIADAMLEKAKKEVGYIRSVHQDVPMLGIIKVGSDPASDVYVRNKVRTCTELGIECVVHSLPESVTQDHLETVISWLQGEVDPHGLILQLPLPDHLDAEKAIAMIDPERDVDGLRDDSGVIPCTPRGIMEILDAEVGDLTGKHAVIVGRSKLVGKPLAKLLLERDCTVTVCHSKTEDLATITNTADILVSAVGKPGLIETYDIKPDAVVIDVGISKVDGKLVGDINPYAEMLHPEARITPVPGGVGKTTVAALVCNLVQLALKRHGLDK